MTQAASGKLIRPIHIKVHGRARFKVEGLYHSEYLKQYMELRLSQFAEILQVSASQITGNILVSYNSGNSHRSIAELIEEVLVDARQNASQEHETDPLKPESANSFKNGSQKVRLDPGLLSGLKALLPAKYRKHHDNWHRLDVKNSLQVMNVSREAGLDLKTAAKRFRRYGPNRLPEAQVRSGWKIFIEQLNSLPVYLLGAAAAVSVFTGGILDAAVIMGVVVANAAIGYGTESKAEKTIHSLKRLVRPTAVVIREGVAAEIPVEEVVMGDLIEFKPGTYVPADCRIIEADHLSIDESMLTGESLPAAKRITTLKRKNIPLGDRVNMAYMGTLVTGGQGLGIAVATGRFSQIGMLHALLADTATPQTPIERQLGQISDQLVIVCGLVCGGVFVMGFLRGYGFLQMLRMAISLAAAAVPEGLPAAATINFALGITRMRKHRVLIRKLQAVETIGAVQTICLDKTGTITQNRMTARILFAGMRQYEINEDHFLLEQTPIQPLAVPELQQLMLACLLCKETQVRFDEASGRIELFGTSTENALIHMGIKAGFDLAEIHCDYRMVRLNHRSETRLFMSSLHTNTDGQIVCSIKGSPYEVLSMCSRHMVDGRIIPLSDEAIMAIEAENSRLAGEAYRVLGVAFRYVTCEDEANGEDLIWLGQVAMTDPIRNGVAPLMKAFHTAGIKTVMITGDQSNTAFAVADQLNISGDAPLDILDSSRLSILDPEALKALAQKVYAYSRVSPAHKLQIVQAIQAAGQTVAMTGDGINDGPALKAASIGIAMGKEGTDVAREVADVVLEDDNLETLMIAVADGRTTYSNIRKSVHFFLSTNFSEIMVMFASMALGIGFPLNVMQLLWINIISDIFPGLALSAEEAEPDVMQRPPRDPDKPLFNGRDYRRMSFESAVISAAALSAYGYGISRYGIGAKAGTLAFQSLTMGQLVHALSCRSEKSRLAANGPQPSNPYLNLAVGGSLLLQVFTMIFPPLRRFLGLQPINIADAAVIGASTALPLVINEATKPSEPLTP